MNAKNLFTYMMGLAAAVTITSCADDYDGIMDGEHGHAGTHAQLRAPQGAVPVSIPEGIKSVIAINWADGTQIGPVEVVNNRVWFASPGAWTTVSLYDAERFIPDFVSRGVRKAHGELGYITDATIRKTDDDVVTIQKAPIAPAGFSSQNFLEYFPAGKNNVQKYQSGDAPSGVENFTLNGLYKSDGNPFAIYPVYSLGQYDLTMGIFYYDKDGQKQEYDIWDMSDSHWKGYNCFQTVELLDLGTGMEKVVKKGTSSVIDSTTPINAANTGGYEILLPEGYLFGFYISSSNDPVRGGKFYSYTDLNPNNEVHAANIVVSGKNYIGFDDQLLSKGDKDLNDIIFYVSPTLSPLDDPSQADIDAATAALNAPVVVPEEIDKLVHYSTPCGIDVEARFDGKGHDYIRIAYPLTENEKVTLDLEDFNNLACQCDDTHITTAGDINVLYVPDGASQANSEVRLDNNNASDTYHNVVAKTQPGSGHGVYQLRVELYPQDAEAYKAVVDYIESHDLCDLLTIEPLDPSAPAVPTKQEYKDLLEALYPDDSKSASWYAVDFPDMPQFIKDYVQETIDDGLTVGRLDAANDALATAQGEVFCIYRRSWMPSPDSIAQLFYVTADGHLYQYDFTTLTWYHFEHDVLFGDDADDPHLVGRCLAD